MSELQNRKFDLEERTTSFGEKIISFCQTLNLNPISSPIINQLVRSGTSIGANYSEANGANSRADFKHKINLAKKESRETEHWLKLIETCFPTKKEQLRTIRQEAHELTLIFSKISRSLKNQ